MNKKFISDIIEQNRADVHPVIHLSVVCDLLVPPADRKLPEHLAATVPQGLVPKTAMPGVLPGLGASLLVPILAGSTEYTQ